ncbi:MAG: ATP-dependent helicase [Chthonomonadales bacterium]
MADLERIRQIANERRQATCADDTLASARELVRVTCEAEGLTCFSLAPNDPLLSGSMALLDRETTAILLQKTLGESARNFTIAHELGHWFLHVDSGGCSDESFTDENLSSPMDVQLIGYSPMQRRESEANVFASEFLLPVRLVRQKLIDGATPEEIAAETGLSPHIVRKQIIESLRIRPDVATPDLEPSGARHPLDESQRNAAEVSSGPVLVEAGPGTGKTSTLVGRVSHLIESGVNPSNILALTFSQKAAAEMLHRLTSAHGAQVSTIWIGTLHAFALDLLRRFGQGKGLPPNPKLITPLQSVDLMSRHIHRFELITHEYLHDPAYPVRTFLSAISRYKDELISPAEAMTIAQRKASEPTADEKQAAANEARIEIARVYAEWQLILRENECVDFGDLIQQAVELMRGNPDICCQIQSEYTHLLVDEYQDINRATAELVRLVAGDGLGLWAVGDLRQAIYQFRGASPTNLIGFETDFPGAVRLLLDVNYRSTQPIVDLFTAVLSKASRPNWTAHRGHSQDAIQYLVAENQVDEFQAIASNIHQLISNGRTYSDIAVLFRSNRPADKIAASLQEAGIPVQRDQPLLDHPTTLEILSEVSILAERNGPGLWHTAQSEPFKTDPETILALMNAAVENGNSVLQQLALSKDENLSALSEHLHNLEPYTCPTEFLYHWLTANVESLTTILGDESETGQLKRAAIYALFDFAREIEETPGATEPVDLARFLQMVRTAVAGGDTSRLTSAPKNGVHVLTVHKAKGLEFPVVILPSLVEGVFPSNRGSSKSSDLLEDDSDAEPDANEEERIFFVALSRARDQLILSRYLNTSTRAAKPSRYLELIAPLLPPETSMQVSTSEARGHEPAQIVSTVKISYTARELETIWTCPKKFEFESILKLPNPTIEEPAYLAMHGVVNEMQTWIIDEMRLGSAPNVEFVNQRLAECWAGRNVPDSAHLNLLKLRSREAILSNMGNLTVGSRNLPSLKLELPSGEVRLSSGGAVVDATGSVTLEQVKFSKAKTDDKNSPRLALFRRAVRETLGPETPIDISVHYPLNNVEIEAPDDKRWEPKRIKKYENALKTVRAGKFAAQPSDRNCSRCPFLFICPK